MAFERRFGTGVFYILFERLIAVADGMYAADRRLDDRFGGASPQRLLES